MLKKKLLILLGTILLISFTSATLWTKANVTDFNLGTYNNVNYDTVVNFTRLNGTTPTQIPNHNNPIYGDWINTTNLFLLMHFNGNYRETSGGYSLPVNSNTVLNSTSSKLGSGSITLSGSGQFVQMNNLIGNQNVNLTISAWFKPASDYTSSQTIFGCYDGSASIWLNYGFTDNKIIFANNDGLSGVTSSNTVTNNNWHHIVAIRKGTTGSWNMTVILDGVITSVSSTSNPSANTACSIGRIGTFNGHYFKGNLDEIAVWDRALTDAEALSIYTMQNKTETPTTIGYYASEIKDLGSTQTFKNITFNYGHYNEELANSQTNQNDFGGINMTGNSILLHFNSEWEDSSNSGNTATPVGGATFSTNYKFGNASSSFDGDADYLNFSNTESINVTATTSFAVSVWLYPTSSSNVRRGIMDRVTDGTNYIIMELNNLVPVIGMSDGGAGSPTATSRYGIPVNTWSNVVFMRDVTTDTLQVYVNGVKTMSVTDTTTGNSWVNAIWKVGSNEAGFTSYYVGQMDELAFFNRSLTPQEINNVYVRGASALNVSIRSCDTSDCSKVPIEFPNYQATANGMNMTGNVLLYHFNDGTVGNEFPSYQQTFNGMNMTGNVLNINLDNNLVDKSGLGNSVGQVNGANFTANSKLGSYAGNFDGNNDYIYVDDASSDSVWASINKTQKFTVSAWVNPREAGNVISSGKAIIGKDPASGSSNRFFYLVLTSSTDKFYGIVMQPPDGSVACEVSANTTIPSANTWYNVILTYDNSTGCNLYVNSVVEAIGTGKPKINTKNTITTQIGAVNTVSFWNGSIDEVAIWNRSLSQSEITNIYNQQIKTFSNDTSGLENNGTLGGNVNISYSPKLGTYSASFNGLGDFIGVGTTDNNFNLQPQQGNFTISTWYNFKGNSFGYIYFHYMNDAGNPTIGLGINGSGCIYGLYRDAEGDSLSSTYDSCKSKNEWHHIVWTRTNLTSASMYVDGVLINQYNNGNVNNISGSSGTLGNIPTIGMRNQQYYDSFFNGSIDEVAIWNRSLSASEVLTIYNQQKGFYDWNTTTNTGTFTDISFLPNNQYLQYNITFFTTNADRTPELYNITIDYLTASLCAATGNCVIDCTTNPTISSNIVGDGVSNMTFTGSGKVIVQSIISRYFWYKSFNGCKIYSINGGKILKN